MLTSVLCCSTRLSPEFCGCEQLLWTLCDSACLCCCGWPWHLPAAAASEHAEFGRCSADHAKIAPPACCRLHFASRINSDLPLQFLSTTASLHGLGGGEAPGAPRPRLAWDLRAGAAGLTLVLWYPPSAAGAAAGAACTGQPPAAAAPRPQAQSDSQHLQQRQQQQQQSGACSSLNGVAADAFQQPGDSVMQAGDSFMSAASQLRWSAAGTSFATAAGSGAWTACTSQQSEAQPSEAPPAGSASRRQHSSGAASAGSAGGSAWGVRESSDDEDSGRLELECTDIVVDASSGGAGGAVTAVARLYALSALEYLPTDDAG